MDSVAMYATSAVMTRHRWAEGLLELRQRPMRGSSDGTSGHISVTKRSWRFF